MTKKKTVVVIGGGVSGMTSALILARFGHDVTLVERSPILGLTVRGFFREGVYFDTGLHYTGGLGPNGPLRRYLRFLGLGDLPIMSFDPDGFDTVRFAAEEREVRLCVGYQAMKARLHELFPGENRVIDDYFDSARNVYLSSPFLNVVTTDIREIFAEETAYDTLAVFLRERTNDPVLRATLSIHSLLHGTPPEEVSFLQHARVAASYFDSVHTFAGGGRMLADGFVRRLAEAGVRVIRGNGVAQVNFAPSDGVARPTVDVIQGVTLDDGAMLDADTVVYTAHPHFLPDLVPTGVFKPAFERRMRLLRETSSAYMLFGISDKPVLPARGTNLFLCPDADLDGFFRARRDITEGPFYVTASPVVKDGANGYGITAAGPGSFEEYAPWANTMSGRRGPEYAAFKKEKLERFRNALVKACPELAPVRFIDGATPLTLRDFTHSPTGSLYGCMHTISQFNPQPVTRVPGLWLAGQSVIAPGLLGAVISSFLVCGFMVGPEALHEELVACG